MKILAFDISKASTGIAFYNGSFDGLQTIKFTDSTQWDLQVKELINKWNPDVITFSETVNRMCGHSVKRIMYGLFYHLEMIGFKYGIPVIPINDINAKHFIGIKMKKRAQIKEDTLQWAKEIGHDDIADDIADAMSFGYYIYHNTTQK